MATVVKKKPQTDIHKRRTGIYIALIFFFCILLLALFISSHSTRLKVSVKEQLLRSLVYTNSLNSIPKTDVLYILGGNQTSLNYKYKTASQLYKKQLFKRTWIMSRTGITEYDPELKRNLTNDEWSLSKLTTYGIPSETIRIVEVNEGFFGTYSEAESITTLMEKEGHQSILLVSSPYHTKRLTECFRHSLTGQNIKIFTYASAESVSFRAMVLEFFKLKVYQYFLL